jgi:hypothetical protein
MDNHDKAPLSDLLINRVKNNKLIAPIIAAATIAIAVIFFWEKVQEFIQNNFMQQVTLVAMNLVPSDAAPFRDSQGIPCLLQDKVLRTFQPTSERLPNSLLQLTFTFSNHAKVDAIFAQADFVVTHTQQIAGGAPGVIEPDPHIYKIDLRFEKGVQPLKLIPPYKIPENNAGAFTVAMTPAMEGIGLCWVLHVVFKTNLGEIRSEDFAITMSKFRKPS